IALRDITFEAHGGQCVALIGPNGAGKSTVLKAIAGIVRNFEGTIKIEGKVGYCPESSINFEFLTADENINYYTYISGINDSDQNFLKLMNLNSGKQVASSFSKGMKRKLDIARSLSIGSDIILLDEPFDGIDPTTAFEIINIIKNLKKLNKIVIVSSHDLDRIDDIADDIFFMNAGKIIESFKISENDIYFIEFEGDDDDINKLFLSMKLEILTKSGNKILFKKNQNIKIFDILKNIISENIEITSFGKEPLDSRYRRLFDEPIF
ncbi:MAG: ATP-binding cassette domain-containing protein, partial [Thermoplasmataceae archaeon]